MAEDSACFPMREQFDEAPYIGTFQQVLSMNLGKPVRIDCVIGSTTTVSYTGVIHEVGRQYVALMQPTDCCVMVDIYSVKFVTFLNSADYT